jgi:hypothetical protein
VPATDLRCPDGRARILSFDIRDLAAVALDSCRGSHVLGFLSDTLGKKTKLTVTSETTRAANLLFPRPSPKRRVKPPICFPPMPLLAMALRALDSAGVTLSQLLCAAYHQSCIDYWVP